LVTLFSFFHFKYQIISPSDLHLNNTSTTLNISLHHRAGNSLHLVPVTELRFSPFHLRFLPLSLKMSSELTFRGHETQQVNDEYSPKPNKPWLSVIRPIRYMLREQRLVFVLIGIVIASLFFTIIPSSSSSSSSSFSSSSYESNSISYFDHESKTTPAVYKQRAASVVHSFGKIPLGIKRKGLRIVVTGGAGFVGSHLVDRLMARGDSVIVVDNFFTGRKENVMHHFGNPRFELIRHDVVEPLLLEVDQIYHLACPASPVHYKFNPVKTIISFFIISLSPTLLIKDVSELIVYY